MFEDVCDIVCGYLATPVDMDIIKELTDFDERSGNRCDTGWDEYTISGSIYPIFLEQLVKMGVAFIWDFYLTEDFKYSAYNFPTEDNHQNYGSFKTGDRRKNVPRLSKKLLKQVESTSAANELLYTMGIKNGSN